jgi:hypothetical protein
MASSWRLLGAKCPTAIRDAADAHETALRDAADDVAAMSEYAWGVGLR